MTQPRRILLLNERCPKHPAAGGAETHLFEVFSRLVARGDAEVELLCSSFEGAAASDVIRGIRVTRLGGLARYYRRVPREVRAREKAANADLIVEALNKVPFLTPLYSKLPVLAIHHHLHGLTAFRQVAPHIALGAVALEQLVPLVYRRTPIVTISRSSKEELLHRGLPEENIDVVPCGLDQELHQPAPLEGRAPIIASVGRVEPYKRIDLAIRAMALVVDVLPDARLEIAGRGQDLPRLQRLTKQLGLEEAVRFLGFVTDEEKVELLQRSSLLGQLSRKEGWGLTVAEANACGTPVVATAVPGLRDSVQDGLSGLLVHRAKPHVVATTLLKLLIDEPRRLQMARYAQQCARRFRWDAAARDVDAAITRALHPAHRSSRRGAPLAPGLHRLSSTRNTVRVHP